MSLTKAEPRGVVPLQRAVGRAAVSVAARDGRSGIVRLHQGGCLKLRFPRLPNGALEGVLINTSGGLTGGDRLTQDYSVEAGANLTVTTQAAERIYRASLGEALVETRANVASGGTLAYLPQETILFDGGRLRRRLDIDLAPDAGLLLCESVILGRTLMGETVRSGLFHDSWRIRRNGRLVFAEEARLDGDIDSLVSHRASLGPNRAFATILTSLDDDGAALRTLRSSLGASDGASSVEGLLVARLAAPSGFLLRKRLMPILAALAKGPLPRVWSL